MKNIILSLILLFCLGYIFAQKASVQKISETYIPNHNSFIVKKSSGLKVIIFDPKQQNIPSGQVSAIKSLIQKQIQNKYLVQNKTLVQNQKQIQTAGNENIYLRDSTVEYNFYSSEDSVRYLKNYYIWNSNNYDTLQIAFVWDTITNNWVNNYKISSKFNAGGYDTITSSYEWDTINNVWVGAEKTSHKFNSANYDTLTINFTWDTITNTWLYENKDDNKYSGSLDTLQGFYNWDTIANQWDPNEKIITKYNGAKMEYYG